ARVLGRYVRERRIIDLETAVAKLSAVPAASTGLRDRGVLREGAYADVVVFDPATVADLATYEEPQVHPAGIRDGPGNGPPAGRCATAGRRGSARAACSGTARDARRGRDGDAGARAPPRRRAPIRAPALAARPSPARDDRSRPRRRRLDAARRPARLGPPGARGPRVSRRARGREPAAP